MQGYRGGEESEIIIRLIMGAQVHHRCKSTGETFTEAEERIIEEMASYISGEFKVADIKQASYKEIFFSDDEMADKWYKAKLAFITIDEKTEKEKRSNVNYLVQAGSFGSAMRAIDEVMGGTMIDYVILSIAETTLWDVFEYKKPESKPETEQHG